ncbi:MBL fold metallo-hydrolase [Chitinibacter sp. S2-10]|uniref:MBL fold metallo-hydrolase n=1 Tax=Chitinibacter sp. S2-10 TaxID=3373597 RepID=UPI003977DC47
MIRTTLIAASLALTFGTAQAESALQMKVYNADANSFHANSTLIFGEKEAIVVDAGFTRADALRIAANVLDSGKQLTTIFVSQADPDYYFGVATLKDIFPNAKVLATLAVLAKISAKVDAKIAFWGPKMGANAPSKAVLPQALQGDSLSIDGEKIEIRGSSGKLAHRPYVWIPSLRAIVGNIGVFGGLHVWTADTQDAAERAAWLAQLDEMAALKPAVVVPGHMQAGTKLDASSIAYTRTYLQSFEKNLAATKNGAELIGEMQQAYPDAGLGIALDIGAKVNKGEMKW